MKIITHWPKPEDIPAPITVQTAVRQLLLEPFDTEEAAKAFWLECPSTVFVLSSDTNLNTFLPTQSQQIRFCMDYPEFEEELPGGYRLLLTIVSDGGAGIYLLIPPGFEDVRGTDG